MPSLFNPAVPTGTIELDEDYINLQNNFQQLSTSFQVNHVRLEDNSTSNGAHTFVEMRDQAGLPPALKAGEGTLYTKTAATVTDLWYTPDNSTNEYQLTRTSSTNIATFGTYTNYPPLVANQNGGWTFLPGGLLFQYGTVSLLASNPTITTIAFPINFTSNKIVINLTRETADNTTTAQEIRIKTGSITNAKFEISQSSSSSNNIVHWQAIGK